MRIQHERQAILSYPARTLKEWGDAIARWRRKGLDVYCYFDNDQKTAAPKDAQSLLELCSVRKKSKAEAAR